MRNTFKLLATLLYFHFNLSPVQASIWPIGATCDVPDTYRACYDIGLECNDQTAVCEGTSDVILGKTCDIPTNYNFCYAAGYTCNSVTAICENTSDIIVSDSINQRLYPGSIFTHYINFGSRTFFKNVDLITDWWQKRPTEIRVYQMVDGEKGPLIDVGQYPEYLSQICGPDYNSQCSYPDAADARLSVDFEGELADGIVIEIEGLLSAPNKFAILKRIEVRN